MKKRNEAFVCENCSKNVTKALKGNCRNHCNYCLFSKHIDISPGDRKHFCKGLMKPLKIEVRKGNTYVLHKCLKCGIEKWNKILEDDRI